MATIRSPETLGKRRAEKPGFGRNLRGYIMDMMDIGGLSQLCFDHACDLLRDQRGVHCETLLALFAGLTGTQLFINEANHTNGAWDLPPGSSADLDGVGQAVDELSKLIHQVLTSHANKEPRVIDQIPAQHAPTQEYSDLVAEHFASFDSMLSAQDIDAEERPFLYAVVSAQAIITVERQVPHAVGIKIVDDGIRRCSNRRPLEYRKRLLS